MGMPASSAFGMNDSGSNSDSKVQKKKFMILALGESRFAVHLHQVREVIATNQVTILPSMPEYFAGVINLRGRIISTVFLKKVFVLLRMNQTNHYQLSRVLLLQIFKDRSLELS